jgi:hypothetical protein
MPFFSWQQFFRQRTAIGLPVPPGQQGPLYAARPLIHSQWNNIEAVTPPAARRIGALPDWLQNLGGAVTIRTEALLNEPKEAIRYFSALLESVKGQQLFLWASAGAAVIYDRARDRIYYGISRSSPGLAIHPTLAHRVQLLPRVLAPDGTQMNTRIPFRHPQTCAEFKALNWALTDGAREDDLDLWCFKMKTMEPYPRCDNCRDTVPQGALARIWTC